MQTSNPQPTPYHSWRECYQQNFLEASAFIQACNEVPRDRWFVSPTFYDVWH